MRHVAGGGEHEGAIGRGMVLIVTCKLGDSRILVAFHTIFDNL
jgi:hypothetical protein